MENNAIEKLDKIADIWNNFILEYKFCNNKIKFTDEIKTNYFGDILGYFHDTFSLISDIPKNSDNSSKFSFYISFLQAIYVQQDFVEELLYIFNCNKNKSDLKDDINYSKNREIRNELVGHPIRKINGKFISSTLFSYHSKNDEIEYLRYHIDNNYSFEKVNIKIDDVIKRHINFLNTYFDLIIQKLETILIKFKKQIQVLEKNIVVQDFETLLKIISAYFEKFLESDFIYDVESLKVIYSKTPDHERYKYFIENFYSSLKEYIFYTKDDIDIFTGKKGSNFSEIELPIIPTKKNLYKKEVSYHYELGKLSTKRNIHDFEFFSSLLKSKCDNFEVLAELKYMEENLHRDIEYYCAYKYLKHLLKN
ncbi:MULTISPECIES: hypothetical protein [Chryseobacterium]|uniref:Uncharacterized protein n=1 Tax=Chryseobacterium geocarposphaerae TaxID=1416776 RepID=A0ABU1LAN8_9FLAO|nr:MULTISPECIES: hypothetical protein [Chryseobacterium]MDR6403764.1 hypothetical protein [Chryseobacterium geocarposphaerae]MDR6697318.1 hypothetical protein [Chryseobacterium ginsenosidimutans]